MTLHIPTMLLAIVLAGGVFSLAVAVVGLRSQRDGMRYWAAGLALHTATYICFIQADALGGFAAFTLATLCRAGAWALFAEGLCEFYRRPPPRTLIWAPVGFALLVFVLLYDNLALRLFCNSLIFVIQSLLVLSLIWQGRRETPGFGKYFLTAGLGVAMALLALRAVGAASGASAEMVSVTQSSSIQSVSLLGILLALILLSLGFLLMSKDRADALNRALVIRDELTGLANRRCLNETLAIEWARAQRTEQPLALAMIDIDHFKLYNDHYGHLAGDLCLKQVAQVIESGMRRAGDLAARYGGEEFLLILPNNDATEAQFLAEEVRKAVESLQLPQLNSPSRQVTISVGVAALVDGCYPDAEALLRAADAALYRAKSAGRNQVQLPAESSQQTAQVKKSAPKLVQLNWRRAYESGNPVIDGQHRALFTHVNKLLDAVLAGHSTAETAQLVEVLVADIAEHFRTEEAILVRSAYPGAHQHADLHQVLLDKAQALGQRFMGGEVSAGELFGYLAQEVVARHILIEDREFFKFLAVAA